MAIKKILLLSLFLIFFATLVSAVPDVNLLSPQSNESYTVGTSVTIDFNVSDADNNRLTLDMNYSATATQGSGTVIEHDLNMTDIYCTDQDWNDGFPSTCAYTWDTTGVPAGCYTVSNSGNLTTTACNYYILLDVNSYSFNVATGSDFNAGSSYITITQTSSVSIDLDNITTLVNNSTTLGDLVMKGVKDQGSLMGLAIGLIIAITLLIALIFSVITIIPKLINKVKRIK